MENDAKKRIPGKPFKSGHKLSKGTMIKFARLDERFKYYIDGTDESTGIKRSDEIVAAFYRTIKSGNMSAIEYAFDIIDGPRKEQTGEQGLITLANRLAKIIDDEKNKKD